MILSVAEKRRGEEQILDCSFAREEEWEAGVGTGRPSEGKQGGWEEGG